MNHLTPLKRRIIEVLDASPRKRLNYHDLAKVLWPTHLHPRAWRYSSNGGPPGWAMPLGRALRELSEAGIAHERRDPARRRAHGDVILLKAETGATAPTSKTKSPTHWMDDRGFVIAAEDRDRRGGDWAHFYNVPCMKAAPERKPVLGAGVLREGRKVKPLHLCDHCNGVGADPMHPYDPCPKCGRSGGLPQPAQAPHPSHL